MYLTLRDRPAVRRGSLPGRQRKVSGTVIALGVVSMFTDISSESINAILPIYLTSVLGMSILAYGFIDGIYQGVSAVVRILGGWLADRTDRPKWIAFSGYFVSALSRAFLLSAHAFGAISAAITIDRLGKGIRTAPRDAMIASASEPEALGRSFGVHRALDTVGALLGPLTAFWILWLVPYDFRLVFVASLAFAVVGVAVLLLIVPDRRPRCTAESGKAARPPGRVSLKLVATPKMGRLLMVAALLGMLTIGDGFLYLELTARDLLATEYFPLLAVGANVAYLALAVPIGRIADKFGCARVYVIGHLALLGSYVCAAGPVAGAAGSVACLVLLGTYYAATDGVLAAVSGQLVDVSARATAIATAQTVVSAARFASSICFGILWSQIGRQAALQIVAVLLAVAIPLSGVIIKDITRTAHIPGPAA